MKKLTLSLLLLTPLYALAALKPMADNEIRVLIVQGSVSEYKGECPCPYNVHTVGEPTNRQVVACGQDSAYFKDPNNKPKCYPEDITASDINLYRGKYNIPGKVEGINELRPDPAPIPDAPTPVPHTTPYMR